MKISLDKVTIMGIDCVDPHRLQEVMDISQKEIHFGAAKILSSSFIDDPRLVIIEKISSFEEFSIFCLKDLVNYVDTEYVLLIQWDGFILNPDNWKDSFLKYDYIGSPWVVKDWSINDFDFPEELRGERVVGNGGFCIRSKRLLQISSRLFNEGLINRFHPEDIAISVWYRDLFIKEGIKFAPLELAREFAFEGDDDLYNNQFGFHGFYTNINRWFANNPSYENLYNNYINYKKVKRLGWKPHKS